MPTRNEQQALPPPTSSPEDKMSWMEGVMGRWQGTIFVCKKMARKRNPFLCNFLQSHFPTSSTCKYPNALLNKPRRFLSAKLLWLELNITRSLKITSARTYGEPTGYGFARTSPPLASFLRVETGTCRQHRRFPGTTEVKRA